MASSYVLELLMTMKDEVSGKLDDVKGKVTDMQPALLAVAGAAIIGVGTLAGLLLDAGKAAAEDEIGIARLKTAVENTGVSWDAVSATVDTYISQAQKRTAFDDDVVRPALQVLTESTGSVATAMDLLPLAMDMARAKGIPLSAAAKIVGQVFDGNTGILARYGLKLDIGTTSTEALGIMQKTWGGQAETYGNTVAGKTELMAADVP